MKTFTGKAKEGDVETACFTEILPADPAHTAPCRWLPATTKEKVKKEYRKNQGALFFYGNHDKTGHRRQCMFQAQARHLRAQRERPRRPARATSRTHSDDLSTSASSSRRTGIGHSKEHQQQSLHSPLVVYSDSVWANHDNRGSTSGYVVMLSEASISWRSERQNIQALSSSKGPRS